MTTNQSRAQRRLAAILAADVVGFSTLMGKDEEGTHRQVKALEREIIAPAVEEHRGRVVKTTGDGFLIEFSSPVEAVRCALSIQQTLASGSLQLRIGINLGDVIIEQDGDVYGEGVNIAARLEALCDPGGVLLSGKVHDEIEGKVEASFESRGEQQVKNIAKPIRVYALSSSSSSAHSVQPKPAPLPDTPSIAVLPFTNLSGDPEQDYFADGVVDDLTTALSRVRWLFVIARQSAFAFKGRAVDVREIGEKLGVRYILEGSIRRSGNRLRINTQLVLAHDARNLRTDRYDREMADVFDLQDEVVRHVVASIEPSILSTEITRAKAKRPDSLTAYDLYLRALPHLDAFSGDGFRAAEKLLRTAIQHDEGYGQAWCALADCLARLVLGGWAEDWPSSAKEACNCAELAISSDPQNGEILASAAQTLAMMAGRYEEVEELAEEALKLHPNSSRVQSHCGYVFLLSGRFDDAIRHFESARRMSPLDLRGYIVLCGIAGSHLFAGRFEDAVTWTGRALEKWPSHAVALRYRAAALAHLGRVEEAGLVVADLLRAQPNASMRRLQHHLYKHAYMKAILVDGLRAAGLPE